MHVPRFGSARHPAPPKPTVAGEHPPTPDSPLEMFHDSRLDWLARYVIIESHRGRGLRDILTDEEVVRRTDDATRRRLLEIPVVVEALCADAVARVRTEIARGSVAPGRSPA